MSTNSDLLCFTNCQLVLEDGELHDQDLWIDVKSGKILDAQSTFFVQRKRPAQIIDLGGNILSPGILDIQINGAYSVDFSQYDGDDVKYAADLKLVAEKIVETGVTSLLPTVITQKKDIYPKLLRALHPQTYDDGANLLGWHAEGPFLQLAKKGAHAQAYLLSPETGINAFEEVYGADNLIPASELSKEFPRPFVRLITAAPELKGVSESIPELVHNRGVVFSVGHSAADSQIAVGAIKRGAKLITHLFNAMPQLHHRDPAIIGLLGMPPNPLLTGPTARTPTRPQDEAGADEALTGEVPTPPDTPRTISPVGRTPMSPSSGYQTPAVGVERPYYGIIVDGIHLHPHSVRLAYTAHPEGCILITDAMSMLDPHLPDGVHKWRDNRLIQKDGDKLTLAGTDTLAGSGVTLDKCVRNFSYFTGTSLSQSIICVTLHPATCLGVQSRKGTLRPGADADLTIWDHEGNVLATWIRGKETQIEYIDSRLHGIEAILPWPSIMRLIIRENSADVGAYVGSYIARRITEFNPTSEKPFVLGLPTGSSPIPTYKYLISLVKKGELSFKHVVTFNMDEYVGLAEEHPESYHSFMFREFFSHIDIDPNNVHILNGNNPDLYGECRAYEQAIKAVGGIELFLGGIGEDGHIAFNEPGSSLVSRTRVKTLVYDTIIANSRFFGNDLSAVPRMALTVGVGTVLDSREVLVVVTGQRKALALSKSIEEGINHLWTLSALQQHPWALIVADEDATAELRVKTVKYFKSIEKVQDEVDAAHKKINGVAFNGDAFVNQ